MSDTPVATVRCLSCGGENLRIPGASEALGVVDSADMTAECRGCGHAASLADSTLITGVSDEQRSQLLRATSFSSVLCWDCDPEAPA